MTPIKNFFMVYAIFAVLSIKVNFVSSERTQFYRIFIEK